MEKNIMYYARVAEQYYQKMVGEGDTASAKYVLLDPLDESCLIVPGYTQMKATDLLFKVKKVDGECVSEFLKNGVPLAEILGLKDCWPVRKVKGETIRIPAEECNAFHVYHELPEDIKNSTTQYIFKLVGLEDITDELYWGWGDDDVMNLFEIMKTAIEYVEEESKESRFYDNMIIEFDRCGFDTPNLCLEFSHFEVSEEPAHPFVYVCYEFAYLDDEEDR